MSEISLKTGSIGSHVTINIDWLDENMVIHTSVIELITGDKDKPRKVDLHLNGEHIGALPRTSYVKLTSEKLAEVTLSEEYLECTAILPYSEAIDLLEHIASCAENGQGLFFDSIGGIRTYFTPYRLSKCTVSMHDFNPSTSEYGQLVEKEPSAWRHQALAQRMANKH